MELVRSSVSIASGLPCVTVRSAPAIVFSGPAQRSLTLRPARSRSRQATLYTESSDSFVASAAASIATGWSEPVPGREFHPLKSSAFHGALSQQLSLRSGVGIFGQPAVDAASSKYIVVPPFHEGPPAATRTPEHLESNARDCVERHPTKRRDVSGCLRMKQSDGHHRKHKHDWRITQEREQG
jgi:hypothetical protein